MLFKQVRQQGVALGGGFHFAAGQLLGAFGQCALGSGHGFGGAVRQFKVNGNATVVDYLVQVPQRQFFAPVIPGRHFLLDGPHGSNVVMRVGHELGPLLRVGFPGGAGRAFERFRARLAKQHQQGAAFFVLGVVGLNAQDVAQLA